VDRYVAATALVLATALSALSALCSGCYTEYRARPADCRAVYRPGHYDALGRWHSEAWRCRR
jgi:hypothetical protein